MSPEKWIYWNTTDRIFYGIACSALAVWAVAQFIQACRSRPKQKVIFVVPTDKDQAVESSSAAE